MRAHLPLAVLFALSLSDCQREAAPPAAETTAASPAGEPAAPAEPATPAAPVAAAPAEFDPASVPESTATLPPFPFFKAPEGQRSLLDDKDKNVSFDREHVIAGDKVIAVEGKVFRDRFFLDDAEQRRYSAIEYQRNYADAIAALGGVEVSKVQYTNEANDAFGGREAVDAHYHGTCASDGCENHTYLIRQGGKEWWIQVSSGAIPLHGELMVLERQAMQSRLGFLDAAAMRKAIDATGKVALYVNFDLDKATLRPDAAPVIDEIVKLLNNDTVLELSIEGHTDATGDAQHNNALSEARAASVVAALVAKGIDAKRLSSLGFGSQRPLVPESDDASRAKNRRVELVKR
jgi:outer membrane protein OmpA-like peptidoglycan-associated protein